MQFSFNSNNLLELNDDELIYIVNTDNTNSQSAFNVIMSRYIDIIRFKAISYRGANTEFDDFVQEGLIALLNAVKSYDKDREAAFATYANICIERRFYSVYKSEKRLKNIPKDAIVTLSDEGIISSQYSNANPLENIIEQEELNTLTNHIKSSLSDFENSVFSYYLNGYSYEEIGKKLNKTSKSIDNAIQRIRKKLKSI